MCDTHGRPDHQQAAKTISRRDLLRRAGIGAGAVTVGSAFLGGAAWAAPSKAAIDAVSAGDVLQIAVARPTTAAQAAALLAFDDTHARPAGGVELLLWPGDRARLDDLGIDYEIRISDLARFDSAQVEAAAAVPLAESTPGGFTDYRTLTDINKELADLAAAYPDRARVVTLQRPSLENRNVFAIEIASNVNAQDGRPVTYIDGVHHAREWPAAEYPAIFAHILLERYDTDPRIKAILDGSRVTIVPVMNVDGFTYSRGYKGTQFDNANLGSGNGEGAYWRKNRRGAHVGQTPNATNPPVAYGVDPNRNYAYLWGTTTGTPNGLPVPVISRTSPLPFDQVYYGMDALSEPETANVADYIKSHNVVGLISNHTSGRLVLRPWGHTTDACPDDELMWDLGDVMAAAMGGYNNTIGLHLYPTTGAANDYAYAATATIGYVFEHSNEFHAPYNSAQAPGVMWPQIIEAFTIMAEKALDANAHSVVKGRVLDASGTAVPATLNIHKEFNTPCGAQGVAGIGPTVNRKTSTPEVQNMNMSAGSDGTFLWHTNPSTRPIKEVTSQESFRLTITHEGQTFVQDVAVDRGQVLDLGEIRLA